MENRLVVTKVRDGGDGGGGYDCTAIAWEGYLCFLVTIALYFDCGNGYINHYLLLKNNSFTEILLTYYTN